MHIAKPRISLQSRFRYSHSFVTPGFRYKSLCKSLKASRVGSGIIWACQTTRSGCGGRAFAREGIFGKCNEISKIQLGNQWDPSEKCSVCWKYNDFSLHPSNFSKRLTFCSGRRRESTPVESAGETTLLLRHRSRILIASRIFAFCNEMFSHCNEISPLHAASQ